jgi:hypothetical protein
MLENDCSAYEKLNIIPKGLSTHKINLSHSNLALGPVATC